MAAKLNLLSELECKNATSEGRAIRKIHDGGGLYLWVYLDGSKFWRLRYWIGDKEKSLSFCAYPETSIKDARKKREVERAKLDSKLDPSAERKAIKLQQKLSAENSFESVAREWYGKQTHTWVQHHADDVKRRLEKNIFPEIGRRPINEIEAPELLAAVGKIERRGAYDLARSILIQLQPPRLPDCYHAQSRGSHSAPASV